VNEVTDPQRPVPAGFNLQELFLPGASLEFKRSEKPFTWRNAFLLVDRALKL